MQLKKTWTLQSLFTCFFWNAVLAGAFFFMADRTVSAVNQWVAPLLKSGPGTFPEEVQAVLLNLHVFLSQAQGYLPAAVFGTAAVVTLFLWISLAFQGRRAIDRARAEQTSAGRAATRPAQKEERKPQAPPRQEVQELSPQPAVQMLALLQRDGRLIDFLQEDLSNYDDAQIGAAVRSVHQGCNTALAEHVELKPVFEQLEGIEVTIPPGFDSRAIRLTGDVSGDPPFKGILRHRGWRVAGVNLPQPLQQQKKDWILAPAEVEIGEQP